MLVLKMDTLKLKSRFNFDLQRLCLEKGNTLLILSEEFLTILPSSSSNSKIKNKGLKPKNNVKGVNSNCNIRFHQYVLEYIPINLH